MDLDEHLAAIQAGDADAFERWVAAAEATVRLALRSFAARGDTEAVLQETLLRIWQVAPRFAPAGRPNALVRLAARPARNLAISDVRRAWGPARHGGAAPVETVTLAVTVAAPDPLLRR